MTNVLLNLLVLLKEWSAESIDTSLYKPEVIKKTSSKLDALMLIFLGRSDALIRKTCLLILIYGDKIFNAFIAPKESSLLSVILRERNRIIKDSVTAFRSNQMDPFALSEPLASKLEAIDFFEICCSNYIHFYRYYFGSLAKIFAETADVRSICHLNKYLNGMVLNRIHVQPPSSIISALANSLTATILMFTFAGAPVNIFIIFTL